MPPLGPRTISEASELIRARKLSPVELARECLDSIERLNPGLNAFITVTGESALAEAQSAEAEIASGHWRGPLHGIPVGLKDLIDTAGVPTTAASAVYRNRIPAEDAEVVKSLKQAGAVLVGKHNLHEFAYGGSSLVSFFGPVRNPVHSEFIAGGSSGGSAAAVASGMCYAAIGTDTAGSIREPAALCGLVGLKPSYGSISRKGIIPLSESLDHAGPITRTVEDAAILLDTLTETPDESSYRRGLHQGIADISIGIPRNFFFEDLDPEIADAIASAINWLRPHVKNVCEISLPADNGTTIPKFEAYAFHRELAARSPELYHPETLRRIRAGEEIPEQEYRQQRRELDSIRMGIDAHLAGADIVLTPATPIPAPRISDLLDDITRLRPAELVLLRNTRPVNIWGLPAISVPCGVTSQGLPIGLQIIGPPRGERTVLRVAHFFEQNFSGKIGKP
jgi:aspartyl-tRNA(Asn)/glutamyl-tRNA(Gln) amidotransferase subunit A